MRNPATASAAAEVATGNARRSWLTLVICCTALFMTTLDGSILNVALPSLQRNLHASTAGLQWSVDGYTLLRASTLFLCAAIGDRFGRRRAFDVGLIVFVGGSLASGLAPNIGSLVAFRCVQGFGSAILTPSSLAIITNTFTDRKRRAMAVGVWSASTGLSTGLGPVLGGILVESFGWRSVFLVNVPVGIVALAATRILTESKAEQPRPFDVPGQAAIGVGLFAITYALISAPLVGWGDPVTIALFVLAGVLAFGFVAIENRTEQPMLPIAVLKSPGVSGSVILAIVAFIAFSSFLFFNTLYLQEVRHFSPLHAGLLVLPTTAIGVALSPLSGHLTGTRGPRLPTSVAALSTAAGMGILALIMRANTPIDVLLGCYLLLGIGQGLINPPLTNAAVSGLPRQQAAVAGAITTTGRQIGTNLGIALVGAVILSIASSLDRAHHVIDRALGSMPAGANFIIGVRFGDLLAAVLSLLSFGVAMRAFRPSAEAAVEH